MVLTKIHKDYYFNVKQIAEYLRPFCSQLDYLYSWDTPSVSQLIKANQLRLITDEDFSILKNTDNYFNRNVLLKNILCKMLTLKPERTQHYYDWIIKEWGGIGGFRDAELYNHIPRFIQDLEINGSMKFDSIASVSKALSFTHPEKYIIYDARIAYSINWIILKTNASEHYFPMPISRNSKLTAFDITTIIRLSNLNLFQDFGIIEKENRYISVRDKKLFITEKYAYSVMCDLIKNLNFELWGTEKSNTPYYTEMLLFSLADRDIFKDIVMSIGINLQNSQSTGLLR